MSALQDNQSFHVSWRDIRDAVLLLPFIHLTLCFIFLFFYSLGNGGAIEIFFAASDIFHVSFPDIAPGYLALLFILVIATPVGVRRTRQRMAAEQSGVVYKEGRTRFILLLIMIVIGALLLPVSILYALVWWEVFGRASVGAISTGTAAIFYVWFAVGELRSPRRMWRLMVAAALLPFITAAYTGASAAEADLLMSYEEASRGRPMCDDYAVLRSIGDHYLAVSKDDAKILIDDECVARFRLPTRPIKDLSIAM